MSRARDVPPVRNREGSADRSGRPSSSTNPGGSRQAPPAVSVPVGFTTFPGEVIPAPRSWVEKVYPNLSYFHEAATGGHFAAWEQPELFAAEIRAAFRSLR
jgi:pimeloyl-ACP methyl ester carboxylesterase